MLSYSLTSGCQNQHNSICMSKAEIDNIHSKFQLTSNLNGENINDTWGKDELEKLKATQSAQHDAMIPAVEADQKKTVVFSAENESNIPDHLPKLNKTGLNESSSGVFSFDSPSDVRKNTSTQTYKPLGDRFSDEIRLPSLGYEQPKNLHYKRDIFPVPPKEETTIVYKSKRAARVKLTKPKTKAAPIQATQVRDEADEKENHQKPTKHFVPGHLGKNRAHSSSWSVHSDPTVKNRNSGTHNSDDDPLASKKRRSTISVHVSREKQNRDDKLRSIDTKSSIRPDTDLFIKGHHISPRPTVHVSQKNPITKTQVNENIYDQMLKTTTRAVKQGNTPDDLSKSSKSMGMLSKKWCSDVDLSIRDGDSCITGLSTESRSRDNSTSIQSEQMGQPLVSLKEAVMIQKPEIGQATASNQNINLHIDINVNHSAVNKEIISVANHDSINYPAQPRMLTYKAIAPEENSASEDANVGAPTDSEVAEHEIDAWQESNILVEKDNDSIDQTNDRFNEDGTNDLQEVEYVTVESLQTEASWLEKVNRWDISCSDHKEEDEGSKDDNMFIESLSVMSGSIADSESSKSNTITRVWRNNLRIKSAAQKSGLSNRRNKNELTVPISVKKHQPEIVLTPATYESEESRSESRCSEPCTLSPRAALQMHTSAEIVETEEYFQDNYGHRDSMFSREALPVVENNSDTDTLISDDLERVVENGDISLLCTRSDEHSKTKVKKLPNLKNGQVKHPYTDHTKTDVERLYFEKYAGENLSIDSSLLIVEGTNPVPEVDDANSQLYGGAKDEPDRSVSPVSVESVIERAEAPQNDFMHPIITFWESNKAIEVLIAEPIGYVQSAAPYGKHETDMSEISDSEPSAEIEAQLKENNSLVSVESFIEVTNVVHTDYRVPINKMKFPMASLSSQNSAEHRLGSEYSEDEMQEYPFLIDTFNDWENNYGDNIFTTSMDVLAYATFINEDQGLSSHFPDKEIAQMSYSHDMTKQEAEMPVFKANTLQSRNEYQKSYAGNVSKLCAKLDLEELSKSDRCSSSTEQSTKLYDKLYSIFSERSIAAVSSAMDNAASNDEAMSQVEKIFASTETSTNPVDVLFLFHQPKHRNSTQFQRYNFEDDSSIFESSQIEPRENGSTEILAGHNGQTKSIRSTHSRRASTISNLMTIAKSEDREIAILFADCTYLRNTVNQTPTERSDTLSYAAETVSNSNFKQAGYILATSPRSSRTKGVDEVSLYDFAPLGNNRPSEKAKVSDHNLRTALEDDAISSNKEQLANHDEQGEQYTPSDISKGVVSYIFQSRPLPQDSSISDQSTQLAVPRGTGNNIIRSAKIKDHYVGILFDSLQASKGDATKADASSRASADSFRKGNTDRPSTSHTLSHVGYIFARNQLRHKTASSVSTEMNLALSSQLKEIANANLRSSVENNFRGNARFSTSPCSSIFDADVTFGQTAQEEYYPKEYQPNDSMYDNSELASPVGEIFVTTTSTGSKAETNKYYQAGHPLSDLFDKKASTNKLKTPHDISFDKEVSTDSVNFVNPNMESMFSSQSSGPTLKSSTGSDYFTMDDREIIERTKNDRQESNPHVDMLFASRSSKSILEAMSDASSLVDIHEFPQRPATAFSEAVAEHAFGDSTLKASEANENANKVVQYRERGNSPLKILDDEEKLVHRSHKHVRRPVSRTRISSRNTDVMPRRLMNSQNSRPVSRTRLTYQNPEMQSHKIAIKNDSPDDGISSAHTSSTVEEKLGGVENFQKMFPYKTNYYS